MKKGLKFAFLGLSVVLLGLVGFGTIKTTCLAPTFAEGEVVEEKIGVVSIEKPTHGKIEVDITEGKVDDVVTITAKSDILYKVGSITVNGTALIEDEETTGKYTFKLVEGINLISANFVVDEEICGDLTKIVVEASEKDWTKLFSVENILIIVKWLLDGGVLIALIKYYIKDKKLESKLETNVKTTINKIIPESTKQTVLTVTKEVITPFFNQLVANDAETKRVLGVFAKCMALSQENTPESRRAILDELSGLNITDCATMEGIKAYIEKLVKDSQQAYLDTMAKLDSISNTNKEIIEQTENEKNTVEKEETSYDGTGI